MLNLAPKIVSPLLDLRSRSEIYLFAGPCGLDRQCCARLSALPSSVGGQGRDSWLGVHVGEGRSWPGGLGEGRPWRVTTARELGLIICRGLRQQRNARRVSPTPCEPGHVSPPCCPPGQKPGMWARPGWARSCEPVGLYVINLLFFLHASQ